MNGEFLSRLCARLSLGAAVEEARALSGGYLHKMYRVATRRGQYAVKILNPNVMRRPDAAANFARAEALEALLEAASLPILPAKTFFGTKMQALDGQFFYVFDFFDGSAARPADIPPDRAARIGGVLARVHRVKRIDSGFEPDEMRIDWYSFVAPLERASAETARMLREAIPLLSAGEARRNAAILKIPKTIAICHGDLDVKNVLWRENDFRVIDLECLSMASPFLELMETSLCWSGLDGARMDLGALSTFVQAYADAGGELPRDWASVFDANWNRPYWLKYSVERILGIGSDPGEKALGIQEAQKTLRQLQMLEAERDNVIKTLNMFR